MNGDENTTEATEELGRNLPARGERAGIYLTAMAAFAVPALIVVALFLSTGPTSLRLDVDAASAGTGLERVSVEDSLESTSDEGVPVEVAGAGESSGDVTVDIGTPAVVVADDSQSAGSPSTSSIAPTNTTSTLRTTTTAPTTQTSTTPTISSTTSPSTTTPTTTTTRPPPPTTTTTTPPKVEPAEFAERIDIGRIGETTLQFRFSSATNTSFTTTVRRGDEIVFARVGRAEPNELVNQTVSGLAVGTNHTVQVTLDGPPTATSPRVPFRTSGGAGSPPATEPVEILGLRVAEVGPTRLEINYDSNICANGSFVIRQQGGPVVGSNSGQAAGCTTRHLAIPGFWTAALTPNTTYIITVQVEADGAGRGNGNTAAASLTVTTSR